MASTVISVRKSISFSAATAAGSGIVVRATYTVPAGKRSRMKHSQLEVNANGAAAGTAVSCFTTITTNATGRVHRLSNLGGAQLASNAQDMDIELFDNDSVTLSTENTSAVAVTMAGAVIFEEYG